MTSLIYGPRMFDNGEDKAHVIDQEDPKEEMMEIEDIAAEPIDSGKINRCGHCRRMQYGHPVPYGSGKCLFRQDKG